MSRYQLTVEPNTKLVPGQCTTFYVTTTYFKDVRVQWSSPFEILEEGMLGIYDLKDSESPLSFQIVKPGTSAGEIHFKIPHSILPSEHYEMRWFLSSQQEVPISVAHLKTHHFDGISSSLVSNRYRKENSSLNR